MLILKIKNISDLAPTSDYVWHAFINDKMIANGKVTGHYRPDGWKALVEKVVKQ